MFKVADKPCPICGGKMFDNREGKKNPKAPDMKCMNKDCTGVVWPPRKPRGSEPPKATPPLPSEWPEPPASMASKIPTPLSNQDYKICAAKCASQLISQYQITNSDMSIVDIREEWEKMYQFILSEICK